MTFSQRIRTLSLDELLHLMCTVEKEIDCRTVFINRLKKLHVRELPLTINTRELLCRTAAAKTGTLTAKAFGELTVKDLFTSLKKEDWIRIQYINYRAYLEIRDVLIRADAPLNQYYGLIKEKYVKKTAD